jgi:lipoprotein-anchoring transpeptidase ErfK/SrfK
MLAAFHSTGKMVKVSTDMVEMTPNMQTTILLKDLNELVAQQKGVTVADLAVQPASSNEAPKKVAEVAEPIEALVANEEPLTDEALAAKYRSDADRLYKEAKRLRDEAEKLSPTKKKTSEASA